VKLNPVLILLFIINGFFARTEAQNQLNNDFNWHLNEEFSYKVSYTFIRLGTVKLHVADTVRIDAIKVYKIVMRVDSNPLLFWVNMHSEFEGYVDEQFRPVLYYSNENINGTNYKGTFKFDHRNRLASADFRSVEDSTQFIKKVLPYNDTLYDGISLIFFARANVSHKKPCTVDVMVEDKKGPVFLNFTGRKEKLSIDGIDEELSCYYLVGDMQVKGIAGVSGPYEGWFSTDSQRVPLYAKLKVFIGSVTIELEEWKNWKYNSSQNHSANLK
jgi:hypothetical protein